MGWGWTVGLWARIAVTFAVTLAAGGGLWAVLAASGTDPGIASGAAGGLAAVVVALGAVWASRVLRSRPARRASQRHRAECAPWFEARSLSRRTH